MKLPFLIMTIPSAKEIEVYPFTGGPANTYTVQEYIEYLLSFHVKSGRVEFGSFSGNPKKSTVTFTTAFPNTNYNVNITGADGRTWVIENKLAGSFVINSQANQALTGDVHWKAQLDGEIS